jgi:hypothetical protein
VTKIPGNYHLNKFSEGLLIELEEAHDEIASRAGYESSRTSVIEKAFISHAIILGLKPKLSEAQINSLLPKVKEMYEKHG